MFYLQLQSSLVIEVGKQVSTVHLLDSKTVQPPYFKEFSVIGVESSDEMTILVRDLYNMRRIIRLVVNDRSVLAVLGRDLAFLRNYPGIGAQIIYRNSDIWDHLL